MIANYSVNFDLIQTFFELLSLQSLDNIGKNFKAIALVVVLVGMAKNCKQLFSNICINV